MKVTHIVLVVGLVVASAAGGIHVTHPRGLVGAFEEWTTRPAADKPGEGGSDPADPAAAADANGGTDAKRPPASGAPRTNAKEIANAEQCLERGDFDGAADNFHVAKLTAGTDAERSAAAKGLDRAVLLWALTQKPSRDAGPASEITTLVQKAETAGTEAAWFEAFRLAAACRANDRLPYIATNLMDAVRHDGPTERWWLTMTAEDTRRTDALQKALANRGISVGGAQAGTAGTPGTAGGRPTETSGIGVKPSDDGTSGIRGSGRRGIPFGNFTTQTRERLAEAVDWEIEGREHHANAAPDKQNRTEHARKAVQSLQKAREVFVAALDEDPRASGLESRIAEITRLISDMKKSLPAGLK